MTGSAVTKGSHWVRFDKNDNPLRFIKYEADDGVWGLSRETGTGAAGHLFSPLLVVARIAGEFVPYDGTASDGSQVPYGIVRAQEPIDADTEAKKLTVLRGLAVVDQNGLTWDEANGDPEQASALTALSAKFFTFIQGR